MAVIYIILIVLIENIFEFFKFRLTAPKIKDLVKTTEMYENIYKKINNEKKTHEINTHEINTYETNTYETNNKYNEPTSEYTLINLLPTPIQKDDNDTMKIELKDFLQKQII